MANICFEDGATPNSARIEGCDIQIWMTKCGAGLCDVTCDIKDKK